MSGGQGQGFATRDSCKRQSAVAVAVAALTVIEPSPTSNCCGASKGAVIRMGKGASGPVPFFRDKMTFSLEKERRRSTNSSWSDRGRVV
jgi:hypothetical protein